MGYDPAGAVAILDSCRDDQIAIEDLVEELGDVSRRFQLGEMLRQVSTIQAGTLSGKDARQAFVRWRRDIVDQMKPKPKRTVFDRLSGAQPKKAPTVWDNLGGAHGV